MSTKNTQVLLVAGALVLSVLLFTAPKFIPPSKNVVGESKETSPTATLDVYAQMAYKNVAPAERDGIEKMTQARQFDSISQFWLNTRRPDLAAHFLEKKAAASDNAAGWLDAGKRYYYAVQFCQDKTEVPILYQCAIRCFQNALSKEPANTDAKIMLASCYVEGTADPMKGIAKLKEIEKTDSNNVQLQLSFAFFSLKSGQTGKAIKRFEKVLEIDSNYIAAYLHLADAYEQQGNTDETISALKKYASRSNDVTARIEIEKYITQLKEQTARSN